MSDMTRIKICGITNLDEFVCKDVIGMIKDDFEMYDTSEEALSYIGQYSSHSIAKDKMIPYSRQIIENELAGWI